MKAFGLTHQPFNRRIWDRWLARLNAEPAPHLEEGIEHMRTLLQARCIGAMHETIENMAEYQRFVERQFGVVRAKEGAPG